MLCVIHARCGDCAIWCVPTTRGPQVADSQYGYSRRFGKAFVGVSLVAITFTKALLELVSCTLGA